MPEASVLHEFVVEILKAIASRSSRADARGIVGTRSAASYSDLGLHDGGLARGRAAQFNWPTPPR
jgi:hypothetical protein